MPENVEIKAHVRDWAGFEARARALTGREPLTIEQVDTFFECRDRLKLRAFSRNDEHPDAVAELIWYARSDETDSKVSTFRTHAVRDPAELGALLEHALGICGVVSKTRLLFMHEATHTRIHLDRVENLGDFMELEVQVQPDQALEDAHAIAAQLCSDLGIEQGDRVAGAYADLLREKAREATLAALAAEHAVKCHFVCGPPEPAAPVDIHPVITGPDGRPTDGYDPMQLRESFRRSREAFFAKAARICSGDLSGCRATPASQASSRKALFDKLAAWSAEEEIAAEPCNPWG